MPNTSKNNSKPKEKVSTASLKRLMRSKKERVIGGVCGGLGEYFNIDPTLIRLLFVIIALSGGSGFLLYLLLWVVIPEEGNTGKTSEEVMKDNGKEIESKVKDMAQDVESFARERNTKVWLGVGVVLFGVYLTLGNFGLSRFFDLGWYIARLWPIFIIAIGVLILVRDSNGKK